MPCEVTLSRRLLSCDLYVGLGGSGVVMLIIMLSRWRAVAQIG